MGTGGLIIGAGVVVIGYMYWKKIGPFSMMKYPMRPPMLPMRPPMMPWPPRPGPMGWPGMPGMPGMAGAMGPPGSASGAPMISANPISLNIGGQPQLATPQTCPDGVNTPNPVTGQCPPPTNPYATSVAGQYGGYGMCSDGGAVNPYTGVCPNGLPPLPTSPTYQTPFGTQTLPYPPTYSPFGPSPYGMPSPYGTPYPSGLPSPYGAPTSPYASPYGVQSPYGFPTGSPYGQLGASPYGPGASPFGLPSYTAGPFGPTSSPYSSLGGFGFLAESYPATTVNPENALGNPEGVMSWGGSTGSLAGQTVLMTPTFRGSQFQPGFATGGIMGQSAGIGTGDWAGGGQMGFSGGITPGSFIGAGALNPFPGFFGGFDGIGGFGVNTGSSPFIAAGAGVCPDGVSAPDSLGRCPQTIFTSALLPGALDTTAPVYMPDSFHDLHHFDPNDVSNITVPLGVADPFVTSPFSGPFGITGYNPFGLGTAEFNPYLGLSSPFSPFGLPTSPFAPSPFLEGIPFQEPIPFPQPYPGPIGFGFGPPRFAIDAGQDISRGNFDIAQGQMDLAFGNPIGLQDINTGLTQLQEGFGDLHNT